MPSVLFVCLGNICRSPAAEGVLKHIVAMRGNDEVYIESCGLGAWHQGQLPDERMRKAAKDRGIDLQSRARAIERSDFEIYDYIFAADRSVLETLKEMAIEKQYLDKLYLINAYSKRYYNQDVPDPYYGEHGDFEHVLDMLADACEGIFEQIGNNT